MAEAHTYQELMDRDQAGEAPLRERQPYHTPRGKRGVPAGWAVASVVAVAAVVAILLFIVQWR